jgi:hypothetical protein
MSAQIMDDFFSERRAVARRSYVCAQCRRGIPRGTRYVRISARSGGQYWAHIAHCECYDFAVRAPEVPAEASISAVVVSACGVAGSEAGGVTSIFAREGAA